MEIELKKITIRKLTDGYQDNEEAGVVGYGGKLDIRPPFQRQFVYKDKEKKAVIDTAMKGFPLNVMYWSVKNDGNFEIIDGQQRTVSLCQYVTNQFSYTKAGEKPRMFHSQPDDVQKRFLDYELMVYFCKGTPSEKLEWFKVVNILGKELTEQELRNAVYAGPWVTDAKRFFSKTGCAAYEIANSYVNGSPIRQDYLETAIDWISRGKIEEYMDEHQKETTANPLWLYFQNVIHWVQATFPKKRKEMKGLPWGKWYNDFKDKKLDPAKLEKEIGAMMVDRDVAKKKGIYAYVLTGDEKYLNLRSFEEDDRRQMYEKQKGICKKCGGKFELAEMEADHIKPWSEGGKTEIENGQMLCIDCNRRKSNK